MRLCHKIETLEVQCLICNKYIFIRFQKARTKMRSSSPGATQPLVKASSMKRTVVQTEVAWTFPWEWQPTQRGVESPASPVVSYEAPASMRISTPRRLHRRRTSYNSRQPVCSNDQKLTRKSRYRTNIKFMYAIRRRTKINLSYLRRITQNFYAKTIIKIISHHYTLDLN